MTAAAKYDKFQKITSGSILAYESLVFMVNLETKKALRLQSLFRHGTKLAQALAERRGQTGVKTRSRIVRRGRPLLLFTGEYRICKLFICNLNGTRPIFLWRDAIEVGTDIDGRPRPNRTT